MGALGNGFGLLFAALAVYVGYKLSTVEDLPYRVKQSLKAVVQLSSIPQERVENFLSAYKMFEMQSFTNSPEDMQLVKDYYETLNHLCAIGNYEKMYLPPLLDVSKDTYSNQKLYEKRMASRLGVGRGQRVLDIGCGRGRVAHLVATETGASVVGINIDKDQLASAREFAAASGMDRVSFIEANYNEQLPFEDESFDAVYYVQVVGGYGTNLTKLFKEAYRVLKPGGKASFEDYIILPAYNDQNALHRKFVQASKAVLGVVTYFNDEEFSRAIAAAGFETLQRGNASVADQTLLLQRDKQFFVPLTRLVGYLHSMGIVPQHMKDMMERMTKGTDDCIAAQKLGLVTGDIETLAQKPR